MSSGRGPFIAADNGVKPGTWGDVSMGWTQRMQQYQHVANRIGTLMSQAAM